MSFELVQSALAVVGGFASIAGFTVTIAYIGRLWVWNRRVTWDDALRVAERLLVEIEGNDWKPDIVVGLGRSGGIWGGWLAGNLGTLPFGVVDLKYHDGPTTRTVSFPAGDAVLAALIANGNSAQQVLVVEGAASKGQTFDEFRSVFGERFDQSRMKFAVLYQSSTSSAYIDFVGERGLEPWPKVFPWHLRAGYLPFIGPLRHIVGARSDNST